jgi:hypothetical protein
MKEWLPRACSLQIARPNPWEAAQKKTTTNTIELPNSPKHDSHDNDLKSKIENTRQFRCSAHPNQEPIVCTFLAVVSSTAWGPSICHQCQSTKIGHWCYRCSHFCGSRYVSKVRFKRWGNWSWHTKVNCSRDLCSTKSWAQTLQGRDAKTVTISFKIAASAASHGTAAKARVVIS